MQVCHGDVGKRTAPSLQLATLAEAVDDPDRYVYELKYDGYRIAAVKASRGSVRLVSRRGQDWTEEFQSVARAIAMLPPKSFVLDGEVCAPDERGVPSFQRLQQRQGRPTALVYVAFDLLELDGVDLRALPLEERRRRLERIVRPGRREVVLLSREVEGDPTEILQASCDRGFEGIVAKRKGAPYVGGRSTAWLKLKCSRRQEFAVVGYLPYLGTQRSVGSLVLALEEGGALHYAGKVGTGFDQATRRALAERLEAHRVAAPAAAGVPPFGGIGRWSEPRLVAEVAFTEWTQGGHVRHPSFVGLRPDKAPLDCKREMPLASAPSAATKRPRTAGQSDDPVVAGIRITHASRVLEPPGVTKLALARYYEAVGERMVPHVRGRPLTLLRWSADRGGEKGGIYLRHGRAWGPEQLRRIRIREKTKVGEYLVADTREALVALAQMDILEIHTWNSTADDLERPDRIVIDIDPDASVRWGRTVDAALRVRELLAAVGLTGFVKTTGGKGLHVVVPLAPRAGWGECLAFTRALAQKLQRDHPREYVASMSKVQRGGKIFIDYLRNNRGSTSVAAFSVRSRPGAPVSMPIPWDEVRETDPRAFTLRTVPERVRDPADPWRGYASARRRLTREMTAMLAPGAR